MSYWSEVLVRPIYVYLGGLFDRWYEKTPWRGSIARGRRGEQLAGRYLRRCGYIILARNYRAVGAEIDLVALDRQTLVFIEVKSRKGAGFGRPQDAVDEEKRSRIRRAAQAYAESRGLADLSSRFDVVAINGLAGKLELLKDAF